MTRRSSRRSATQGEYEVGYCKPPKHTRYKPGQSGNAKGRPRGQRNLKTAVKEALKEKITMREGERTRTVSRLDAIVRVTINNALKGDPKALAAFIQLIRPTGLMDEEPDASCPEIVSAEDDAILTDFLARQGFAEEQGVRDQVPCAETKSPTQTNDMKPRDKK